VEQVAPEPSAPIRVEALPASRQEPGENEILADVGLKLQLEERYSASGVRSLGGDQEMIELFHEDGERIDVVVVETALRRFFLEAPDHRIRVIDAGPHAGARIAYEESRPGSRLGTRRPLTFRVERTQSGIPDHIAADGEQRRREGVGPPQEPAQRVEEGFPRHERTPSGS
jgi:hypothetical protein